MLLVASLIAAEHADAAPVQVALTRGINITA
jgi:hypothetical protein